eukprot:7343351-Lingulodinium_polyedra.AAC.1
MNAAGLGIQVVGRRQHHKIPLLAPVTFHFTTDVLSLVTKARVGYRHDNNVLPTRAIRGEIQTST